MTTPLASVTVQAPAKVNLALVVGPVRPDGYHELATIFQAVALLEEVTLTRADEGRLVVEGRGADLVPTDRGNLVWKAVDRFRRDHDVPPLAIHVRKQVPVAGGMAGGSADAAATLVALDALLATGHTRADLCVMAAELGADVPFGVVGGTALGTGAGDDVQPVLTTGSLHWVFALSGEGLSTPAVFRAHDALVGDAEVPAPAVDPALLRALRSGDAAALGALLTNDLQPAALQLQPALADTLAVGREAGALGALVSGSGPTTAFLAADARAALDLAVALTASGVAADVIRTTGPAPGARVVASTPLDPR